MATPLTYADIPGKSEEYANMGESGWDRFLNGLAKGLQASGRGGAILGGMLSAVESPKERMGRQLNELIAGKLAADKVAQEGQQTRRGDLMLDFDAFADPYRREALKRDEKRGNLMLDFDAFADPYRREALKRDEQLGNFSVNDARRRDSIESAWHPKALELMDPKFRNELTSLTLGASRNEADQSLLPDRVRNERGSLALANAGNMRNASDFVQEMTPYGGDLDATSRDYGLNQMIPTTSDMMGSILNDRRQVPSVDLKLGITPGETTPPMFDFNERDAAKGRYGPSADARASRSAKARNATAMEIEAERAQMAGQNDVTAIRSKIAALRKAGINITPEQESIMLLGITKSQEKPDPFAGWAVEDKATFDSLAKGIDKWPVNSDTWKRFRAEMTEIANKYRPGHIPKPAPGKATLRQVSPDQLNQIGAPSFDPTMGRAALYPWMSQAGAGQATGGITPPQPSATSGPVTGQEARQMFSRALNGRSDGSPQLTATQRERLASMGDARDEVEREMAERAKANEITWDQAINWIDQYRKGETKRGDAAKREQESQAKSKQAAEQKIQDDRARQYRANQERLRQDDAAWNKRKANEYRPDLDERTAAALETLRRLGAVK